MHAREARTVLHRIALQTNYDEDTNDFRNWFACAASAQGSAWKINRENKFEKEKPINISFKLHIIGTGPSWWKFERKYVRIFKRSKRIVATTTMWTNTVYPCSRTRYERGVWMLIILLGTFSLNICLHFKFNEFSILPSSRSYSILYIYKIRTPCSVCPAYSAIMCFMMCVCVQRAMWRTSQRHKNIPHQNFICRGQTTNDSGFLFSYSACFFILHFYLVNRMNRRETRGKLRCSSDKIELCENITNAFGAPFNSAQRRCSIFFSFTWEFEHE